MSCPPVTSLHNCSIPTSYIRPDEGFAITPWVCSAVLFAAHLASSITRVFLKQYDRSQLLAIVLAVYGVSITILAYQSTRFEAEKIYIWTPLLLGGDIAALIHLIKEQYPDNKEPQAGEYEIVGEEKKKIRKSKKLDIFCMIISAILLVALLVLQGAGLFFSISHFLQRNHLQLQTTWCSPAFQLGNETFNAECVYLPITQYETLGIACVSVPGDQATWLGWTAFGLFMFLIFEIIEFAILFIPRLRNFRNKYHYRAPFITTLGSIIVWFAFIMIAWSEMKHLPEGLSESRLGIVTELEGICAFDAFPGGLRGTIIAWSDGIFGGWSLYQ